MATSNVYVLYTGGTFGMEESDAPGNPLIPIGPDRMEELLPPASGLKKGAIIDVKYDSLPVAIDSSSMTPRDWITIGKRIYANYKNYDGFVVIQGTDTLSYTASALSFMFENLGKPIVVTGSQLPLGNPRTDARLNYGHAVMVAGYKATDLPRIPEVVVVFADKILRGCRTRKMSASAWTGFESPNAPPLGEIGEHVRIYESQIRPPPSPDLEVQLNTELVSEVLDISLYPGLRPGHLASILSLDSVQGVVFRTYGTGNAPEDADFIAALSDGIKKENKTVVNITQCPQGSVEMGLYASSVKLLDVGVISGLDMTPEAALTKLMVILGTRIGDQIKLQMQINQRGEQSQNLFDLVYDETRMEMSPEKYSEYVLPDRRFNRDYLSNAVLRIRDMRIEFDNDKIKNPAIYVFMNFPKAETRTIEELDPGEEPGHPRLVRKIDLKIDDVGKSFPVVESLSKEQIRNIIGDSDIVLTLVPSKGVKFAFERLSLSLFTRA
jgi:L-asparaginase